MVPVDAGPDRGFRSGGPFQGGRFRTRVAIELVWTKSYSTFKNEWDRFVGRTGFEDARPYSLRQTFATLNLAHGENIRAI